MPNDAFGNLANYVAAVISIGIISAWLIAELITQMGIGSLQVSNGNLFAAATAVIGYVFGTRSATNGASRLAQAAHMRLDAISAPSSNSASALEAEPPVKEKPSASSKVK